VEFLGGLNDRARVNRRFIDRYDEQIAPTERAKPLIQEQNFEDLAFLIP